MTEEIVKSVLDNKIIAIIRGFPPEICLKLAEAYAAGGIKMIEVTFPQAKPAEQPNTAVAIKAIRERFAGEVMVGAGTVLTQDQLKMAADAGAQYMITPSINTDLIREAVQMGLVAMPGALTPTEAVTAFEAGARFVKIFPAGNMGPSYIKAIKAPLAHIPLLAVGGISPDNVADYLKAGCVGAGVGGNLTNKEWIAAGAWDKIQETARLLVERAQQAAKA